jgi:glycerol-3-phosphate dehydrogenase (NAD+)
VDVQGTKIQTFATLVNAELGISCSSLSGANIALEVAQEKFSESTLGVPAPDHFDGDVHQLEDAVLWKNLFHTQNFRINVVPDVEGVGLCGALKSTYFHGQYSRSRRLTYPKISSLLPLALSMA